MKKLFLALALCGLCFNAVGCKDSVEVDVNKKKSDCCKPKSPGSNPPVVVVPTDPVNSELAHCPCLADVCDKNPADYSPIHACPCSASNCVCPRG